MKLIERLHENISAISGQFHGDHKRYQQFYKKHGEKLSGFPGVWRFCLRAAEIFTEAEIAAQNSGSYEWIDAIDFFVAELQTSKRLPTDERIRSMAIEAFTEAEA